MIVVPDTIETQYRTGRGNMPTQRQRFRRYETSLWADRNSCVGYFAKPGSQKGLAGHPRDPSLLTHFPQASRRRQGMEQNDTHARVETSTSQTHVCVSVCLCGLLMYHLDFSITLERSQTRGQRLLLGTVVELLQQLRQLPADCEYTAFLLVFLCGAFGLRNSFAGRCSSHFADPKKYTGMQQLRQIDVLETVKSV